MTINEMRKSFGDTQSEFASRYNIPFRTIQNWESGLRTPPAYVSELLEKRVRADLVNRRTNKLPAESADKLDLPRRDEYVGAINWLRAVNEALEGKAVFALDEALMCKGLFLGRDDEYLIWVYGDDILQKYNGVVVLGNTINSYDVEEINGIRFTKFNRTLDDAMANDNILDMQGITEALSKYYYTHGNTFAGLSPSPEFQDKFAELAENAINYYSY